MFKFLRSIPPRALLVLAIVALVVLVFGLFQVYTATRRYDDLAAIPIQSLLDTAQNNQSSADTLAMIEKNKDDAALARNQAMIVVGAGVVLLGLTAFLYSQQPDQPARKQSDEAKTSSS